MKVRVNYPGYWAHGQIFAAERETLHIKKRDPMGDARREKYWGARKTDDGSEYQIDCFIIEHPEFGKFGIPVPYCVVLEQAAA